MLRIKGLVILSGRGVHMIFVDNISYFLAGLLLFRGLIISFTRSFVMKLLPEHSLAALKIYWGPNKGLNLKQ